MLNKGQNFVVKTMDMQKILAFLESTLTKYVNNAPVKNMNFFTFFPIRWLETEQYTVHVMQVNIWLCK